MIVNETAIHQKQTKFNLLQVTLRPSTMDRDPYRKTSCKKPRKIQNVSIFMKNNHRPNLRQRKTNDKKQTSTDVHRTIGSWLGTGT